jgi:hypothetical protein
MWPPAALVAFDSLRNGPEWRRWGQLAAGAPPYLAPAFFALVRPLVETGTPLVAEAWTADRMLGALPLVLEGDRLRGLRTDHSPGFDYLGSADGIDAIWDSLREDKRWTELVIDKLPIDSPLAHRLPELARRASFPVTIRDDVRHPYFMLPGFEAALHAKFRANLHRCERKAGDVVLEAICEPSACELAEAMRLEGLAWKQSAGSAIESDAKVARVYAHLQQLPGARLAFLRIKGQRVATLFSLEDEHTIYALKIGYDPAHASVSPGHLLVWKAALDAEARGLAEWNFVGREDEWKKRWTDAVHEHVSIVVYRRSARGIVRHALRDVLKPMLPEQARITPRSPLPRHCQKRDHLGDHALRAYVRGRLRHGLGIRSRLRHRPRVALGAPSRFPVGSWVRVVEHPELDAAGKLRGLAFTPAQWQTAGHVFKVERHVRRIRDDKGRFRAVDGTVLLEGADCGSEPLGCGRHCPLMYRDEWLAAAEAPVPTTAPKLPHARVRDLAEIHAGLDLFGRRDGLTFMPEMAAFAGKRLPIVEKITRVFELDRWIRTPHPLYILADAHCSGALDGPCDRACALLWHEDWLVIEGA